MTCSDLGGILLNLDHELEGELEAGDEDLSLRALDAVFGQRLNDFAECDEDGRFLVEVRQLEALAFAFPGLDIFARPVRVVMAAEAASVDCGCAAWFAGVEGMMAMSGHTVLLVSSQWQNGDLVCDTSV